MQTEQTKQLKAFLKKAISRGNVPFKVEAIQKDMQGNITALSGTVTETFDGKQEVLPMLWNLAGTALVNNPPLKYDLVEAEKITY